MVVAALVFFDASWPRRWLRAPPAPAGLRRGALARAVARSGRRLRIARRARGRAAYMLVQILLPLRSAPLRRQRALARAGDAVLVAGDGAREERQRDVHRPRSARRQAVARVAGQVPDPHPGARDGGSARSDPAAGPPHRARVRGRRASGRRGPRRRARLAERAAGRRCSSIPRPIWRASTDGIGRKRWILPAPDSEPPHLRRSRLPDPVT